MNISLTPRAEADLDAIYSYISLEDDHAAKRVIARILQAIAMLEQFPFLGRVGRVAETRELSIVRLSYFAVYRIVDEIDIEVIAIIHDRQKFPPDRE
ncbi:type II toxin-antitoxin system RelE/ParE family toxin [Neorhizobium sp. LjRoot104]|uniref:type II toxin-antitoxin system RelE/ParE family toxin n=1 Tax=Neorhizobium sp. LjRoot104 TaxID=3342254 RepID=UPI003ECC8D96